MPVYILNKVKNIPDSIIICIDKKELKIYFNNKNDY